MTVMIRMKTIFFILATVMSFSLNAQTSNFQVCDRNLPESTPNNRFILNGNATIIDRQSSLMWKPCPAGMQYDGSSQCVNNAARLTWEESLRYVYAINGLLSDNKETSSTASNVLQNLLGISRIDRNELTQGFSDWRLPNIKELASIVEYQCQNPAINLTVFPNTLPNAYWSSTSHITPTTGAWSLFFEDGNVNTAIQSNLFNLRLVRSIVFTDR